MLFYNFFLQNTSTCLKFQCDPDRQIPEAYNHQTIIKYLALFYLSF